MSGPKNLRQKAHSFYLNRSGQNSSDEFPNYSHHIRFKIYADSTIRRGKRSLRRNCILFKLSDLEFLHISCKSGFSGRGSLKWTEEKQERFLAFESELGYAIQVITTKSDYPEDLSKKTTIEPILDSEFRQMIQSWKSDLTDHSNQSVPISESLVKPLAHQNISAGFERGFIPSSTDNAAILPVASISKSHVWQMEPSAWNMTLNTEESFFATIISNEKLLPLVPPIVIFSLRDLKVEISPMQYDRKNRRSFMINVPKMISNSLIKDAFQRLTKISRSAEVSVVDESGKKLWHTSFTFEAGIEARGTHLPRNIEAVSNYAPSKFSSPMLSSSKFQVKSKSLRVYIEVKGLGTACAYEVDSTDRISNFKRRVQNDESINLPPKQQCLIFKGVELDDSFSFGSYEINNGDLIFLQQKIYDYYFLKKLNFGISSLFNLFLVESSKKAKHYLLLFSDGTPKSKRNELVSSLQSWCVRFPSYFLNLIKLVQDDIDSSLPLCIIFEYTKHETLKQFISLRNKNAFLNSQVFQFASQILNIIKELHNHETCVMNLSCSSFFVFMSGENYFLKMENIYNVKASSNSEKSMNMAQCGRVIYQIMTLDLEIRSLEEMSNLLESYRESYKGLVDVVQALLDVVDVNRPSAIQSLQALSFLQA
jgi:hypothetical protein